MSAVKQKKRANKKGGPANQTRLTIPDMVILSLLAERPMHGYEVNATFEERQIRDWAPVSRPQIYYSLEKLVKLRLVRVVSSDSPAAGPERRVLETTAAGRKSLADELERKSWVDQKVHQPFLIWLALSWQARPSSFQKQLRAREKLVEARLAEERATLADVMNEVGHPYHEAVWMLELVIEQQEVELRWIRRILKNAHKRAPARHD
ncbi:MAG TPA: PadR family transcriptional regulator [Pyrinomonadaceae bacterium]|nr:PadR family transcriptional regulator [Pyrinomonadaceae bacterium]